MIEDDLETVEVGEPSRLVQKTIVIDRWLCRHADHNHKTKEFADNCLAKSQLTGKTRYDPAKQWALYRSVVMRTLNGETFSDIARDVDRSPSRIGEIFNTTTRKLCFNDAHAHRYGLSTLAKMKSDEREYWLDLLKQFDDVIVDGDIWKAREHLRQKNAIPPEDD